MSKNEPNLEERLDEIRTANQESFEWLRQQGKTVNMAAAMATRLSTLVDFLMPEGTKQRTKFELAYEAQIGEMLDQAKAEIARQKLTAGLGHEHLTIAEAQ